MNLRRMLVFNLLVLIILVLLTILKLDAYKLEASQIIQPNTHPVITPEKYRRPLVTTLLTFPEWYLVYSPEEYANFTRDHFANQFPFFSEIWQYWDSYAKANQLAARLQASSISDQVMLLVIGSSTTVEYFFRGFYERTIGTLSADISGRVEEDNYAAKVAKQYVVFIKKQPWYMFDFFAALKGLWFNNHFLGQGFFRKIERKYALSTEYLLKALYGKLIEWGSHAAYGVASVKTVVVANNLPNTLPTTIARLKKTRGTQVLLLMPRLDAFANSAILLANQHVEFKEIAGNNAFITLRDRKSVV